MVYDFHERFPEHIDSLLLVFPNQNAEPVFDQYFTYNEETGTITTSANDFDRDVMADTLGNYVAPVVFNISVASFELNQLFEIIDCIYLVINVIDIDDQVPTFATSSPTIMFRDDDEEIRQFHRLPQAPDKDEGDNGTRIYTLEDSMDGTFELDIIKDVDTQKIEDVLLRNLKPLNREDVGFYNLTLIASEGKEGGDMAHLPVYVVITDVCDETPDFGTSSYDPTVPEDTSVGHTIMTLHAEDLDSGSYGEVTYHIKSICAQKDVAETCIPSTEAEQLFDLDMETGNLVLQEELDREEQAQYDIMVEAVDGCGRSATATVAIQVEDVNDNDPTIHYTGLERILENTADAFLGLIDVTDLDVGLNGTVTVELYDESTDAMPENFKILQQVINPNRYQLELIQELDRELVTSYSFAILAHDQGTPPRSSSYPLVINVLDENDNRPVFDPIPEMIVIKENEAINTLVFHLHASDQNVDTDNSNITFSLPTSEDYPHQDLFHIEATTGRLLVARSLDREEHEVLPILVMAQDNPLGRDSPLNSTTVVKVVLEDVNDNFPVFYPSHGYHFNISVNMPVGIIATLDIRDADEGDNARIEVTPASGTLVDDHFIINPSGTIDLVSSLDQESLSFYTFEVEATDYGSPRRTTRATINITVLDYNNTPPGDTNDVNDTGMICGAYKLSKSGRLLQASKNHPGLHDYPN